MDTRTPKSTGRIVEDGWETASVMNPLGSQYKLGKKAVWVWKCCTGGVTMDKLTREYGSDFNIGSEEALSSVVEILANLEKIGLISLPPKTIPQ